MGIWQGKTQKGGTSLDVMTAFRFTNPNRRFASSVQMANEFLLYGSFQRKVASVDQL